MIELLRSNDTVLLNFIEALLRDASIESFIFDNNMSVMQGSIASVEQRLLVADTDADRAKRVLEDAELGQWLRPNI